MATGLIYVGLYIIFGLKIKLGVALLFASVLIPLVVIDLQQQIIPDQLNMTGAIAGLLAIVASDITFINALIGAFIGGGLMLLIAVISRGGMGGGDIKMMAWVGLFLGWKLTLLALFLSFLIGGLGSLILILFGIKKRKDFIPFGPFLAIGGFTAYAFGYEILAWYLTRAF
jgi:leader peptidase (prepilin peptidase)/N-methyltransferase